MVCVSVCVCWAHGWALQKWLNRSRCRLGANSCGSKETARVNVGRIHSLPQWVTKWRCDLLSEFFDHLLLLLLLLLVVVWCCQAAVKLGEIESQLQRGHTTAEKYSYMATAIVDVSTPAIHSGHSLIAKIGGTSVPAAQGVQSAVIIRPHRLHAVNEMRPIATDVARSVVCLSVCLSVCWAHGWAVQKRVNWSRCRLGEWLTWFQGTCVRWGFRSLVKRDIFEKVYGNIRTHGECTCPAHAADECISHSERWQYFVIARQRLHGRILRGPNRRTPP